MHYAHYSAEPLTEHFSLKDLCYTGLKVPNKPESEEVVHNLRRLATHILEPVKDHFRRRIVIHSGYQSSELAKLLPGHYRTTQHSKGEAVDFRVEGIDNYDLARWIESNLDFDELMLEYFVANVPNSGWVHCSFTEVNRKRTFTDFRGARVLHAGLVLVPAELSAA